MSNDFFTPSGAPSTNAALASATIRAEFALIQAGFDKLCGLSGNGLKVVRVNAGGSSLEAVAVTGTGSAVFSTSPSLVTPVLGAASATSISVSGQITSTIATGTAPLVIASTTQVPNLYVARAVLADTATTATTAASVTTNANLTGPITSSGNATSIASQTGTGTKFVVDTSPTLVTPILGVAAATSINKMLITAPATSSTLAIADGKTHTVSNSITLAGTDGKTLTVSNNLTLAGTDGTAMTFPSISSSIAPLASPTFTGTVTAAAITASGAVAAKAASEQSESLAPGNNAGVTVDWSFGGSKVTHTGTNAITFSNVPATGIAGKFLDLDNLNNFSFPAAVDWGLGGIPSIAGRVIVNLTTDDGGTKVFAAIGWRAV